MSNLNKFCRSIIENNGASYNLNTGEFNPDEGYFVSLKGTELLGEKSGVTSLVYKFVQENGFQLSQPDKFLGGWVDEKDDSVVVLDVSVKLYDLNDAIELGKKNNQEAIYDAYNKEVIKIKED